MKPERVKLAGFAASPGLAVGKVTVFDRRSAPVPRRRVEHVEFEIERLESAAAKARQEVEALRDGLGAEVPADHRLLLETQLLMLGDELMLAPAYDAIRDESINAEWALRRSIDALCARLGEADSPYFRERATDIRLVGDHVLRVLTGTTHTLPELREPTIFVAGDLTPAEAIALPAEHLKALVTGAGSASGHTAILARALHIPAVVGVPGLTRAVGPGDTVIVDGLRGEIIVQPSPDEEAEVQGRASRFHAFVRRLRQGTQSAAKTLDGSEVTLLANIEIETEAAKVREEGGGGIGLFRTEFLFLGRREPPSEAEQTQVYQRVARRLAPHPVIFRTFDLGADKMPVGLGPGANPALGLRALRFAFERPELLVTQLRALLRAATGGNVSVMFPMVSGVDDWRRASVLLERARQDLDAEGAAYGPIALGVMLEVPSAVVMADRLAPHVDFFSIGTNDLTQYTLAVDRGDPRVARFGSSLDPSVLRLIDRAREVAEEHGKPLSICGELAGDPVATPVLLGLGLRRLSMARLSLPLVREVISRLDLKAAVEVARASLDADGPAAVERLVGARFGDTLGDLWSEQGIELPRV